MPHELLTVMTEDILSDERTTVLESLSANVAFQLSAVCAAGDHDRLDEERLAALVALIGPESHPQMCEARDRFLRHWTDDRERARAILARDLNEYRQTAGDFFLDEQSIAAVDEALQPRHDRLRAPQDYERRAGTTPTPTISSL